VNCDLHALAVVMRCGVGTLRWAVTDPSDVGPWLRASCCGILTFVALCSAVSAATAALDREAALRYVLSRRTPEGGYCFYRKPKWGEEEPNAPDTLAAMESLRPLDVEPPEPERTERFLCSLQDEDGDYPTLTSDGRRSSVSTRSVPSPVNPLTLGVDRDSEIVAFDYDERDEGVKEMIRLAVEGCRRNGIHSGLCGQAPSDYPDMGRVLGPGRHRVDEPQSRHGGEDHRAAPAGRATARAVSMNSNTFHRPAAVTGFE
jgi:PEP-utilising enzyme, PEP-binding domain